LNASFERKRIPLPYFPDMVKIGRQTNNSTMPTSTNGFFDSKSVSRSHAVLWADQTSKIWIRDTRSTNGTFVNGHRVSEDDSEPRELQLGDRLELGIDIVYGTLGTAVHPKIDAKVDLAGFACLSHRDIDPGRELEHGEMWMKLLFSGEFVSVHLNTLLNRSPEDLVGTSLHALMRPDSRVEFDRMLAMARGRERVTFDHEVLDESGVALQVQTTLYGDAGLSTDPTFLVAKTQLLQSS
jgi:hypothetical protein